MMSEQHFDARLKHIEEQYQAKREGADAYRDQEMARLFEECGWTQERIAERVSELSGKRITQSRVSRRLVFGRFLKFMPSGHKGEPEFSSGKPSWLTNLTERRFREHWKRTKGRERERFAAVAHALEHGIPHGFDALIDKPGIGKATAEALADGKWYTVSQITASVEESLPGATEEQVREAVRNLRARPPQGQELKTKKIGKKCQYRLGKRSARPGGRESSFLEELMARAAPLLDELDELGRMSMARLSPGLVRNVAFRIRKLFESLMEEATA